MSANVGTFGTGCAKGDDGNRFHQTRSGTELDVPAQRFEFFDVAHTFKLRWSGSARLSHFLFISSTIL
jgi:hypothetical protein